MIQAPNEKEWAEVNLEAEFDFERGKEKNMAALSSGEVPLISARKVNNGIKGFVENPVKVITGGRVISLNNDGDGGAGLAYFQPMDFALDTHVTALHPKKVVPEMALLFLSTAISKQHAIFGHGRSISLSRAKRLKTMLPVTRFNEPDYDYMAQYISEKRAQMLIRYKHYVAKQLSRLEYETIPALSKMAWRAFHIGELFNVSRPNARNKDDYRIGDIPFVASGTLNNGVMKFCTSKDDDVLDKGNCITVSPVDGSTFYQPMDFLGRGGAGSSILILRCAELNRYRGQFMARIIQQTCSKYMYGHMGNKNNIKREQIMLPVNDAGKPDFEYMEQYTKNIMLRKYEQYLAFVLIGYSDFVIDRSF